MSDVIRNGQGNMLALKAGTLSDADLAALVAYVQAIGRGEVAVGAEIGPRPLAPVQALCFAVGAVPARGQLRRKLRDGRCVRSRDVTF